MLNYKLAYGENKINYDVKGYRMAVHLDCKMVWEEGEPVFYDIPDKFKIDLRYRNLFVTVWSIELKAEFDKVQEIADKIIEFANRCSIRHPKKLLRCLSQEDKNLVNCYIEYED